MQVTMAQMLSAVVVRQLAVQHLAAKVAVAARVLATLATHVTPAIHALETAAKQR